MWDLEGQGAGGWGRLCRGPRSAGGLSVVLQRALGWIPEEMDTSSDACLGVPAQVLLKKSRASQKDFPFVLKKLLTHNYVLRLG